MFFRWYLLTSENAFIEVDKSIYIHHEGERSVWSREDEGVRKLISHIGPIPILIPLKLFLVTKFKFQNVISSVWITISH